ncbi:MAG: hypothetical protein IKZ86_10820 [Spirochaetaceae bacterium]|nr:hypothetical protein [Spirochaetaceae bacterium]
MAIQNFLAGGYYGKLGATVGQRWKNKRTIRTYVVPANPRTEIQQANRGKFANAVSYAQMGMQMNYYATCFSDPNFTHWNYRMKTARELKNAGLTNLDLIPLYPLTFTPPTLINEIQKDTVTGLKHIRFAVSALNGNEDRTLSLMFALYDEQDHYLGLKLYLGYYYAANPGYLEVDVDDVNEINSHCFVRIVSNDDEDSSTDLIASPSLQVQASSIDIHDFDTAIVSLSKDNTGVTITFAELWKGTPSNNEIGGSVNCVIDGALQGIDIVSEELFNNGGYCAVKVPYIAENNQYLPAFPSGSSIDIDAVTYEGATWQINNTNQTENYSDSDLTRNIVNAPAWNASDTGDITFKIEFEGVVAAQTKNFNMVCSGRFNTRTAESQSFNVVGDDEYLTFTCTGNRKQYPMMNSGDQISVTAQSFVCNGVTYQLAAQNVALRNAIRTSYIMEEMEWGAYRDGGGSDDLEYLELSCWTDELVGGDEYFAQDTTFYVEITPNLKYCMPSQSYIDISTDGDGWFYDIRSEFSDSANRGSCGTSKAVLSGSIPSFTWNGITYTFHNNAWVNIHPHTVGDFEL